MNAIKKIWSREILDSRGIPTVECYCLLTDGRFATTSVPAGTSMGSHEALELRDKDEKRYHGEGVLKACENINTILGPALEGVDPIKQVEIDQKLISLDGTENKTKYGGNAILAISQVVCKIAAISENKALYTWINELAIE